MDDKLPELETLAVAGNYTSSIRLQDYTIRTNESFIVIILHKTLYVRFTSAIFTVNVDILTELGCFNVDLRQRTDHS